MTDREDGNGPACAVPCGSHKWLWNTWNVAVWLRNWILNSHMWLPYWTTQLELLHSLGRNQHPWRDILWSSTVQAKVLPYSWCYWDNAYPNKWFGSKLILQPKSSYKQQILFKIWIPFLCLRQRKHTSFCLITL